MTTKHPTSHRTYRIWIDLDNSPHVLLFAPIIRRLKASGMDVIVTIRRFAQTEDLAVAHGLEFTSIGAHDTPRSTFGRVVATFRRAWQLAAFVKNKRPEVAVSHGSRSLVLASWLLRIPSLTLYDYEFVSARMFQWFSKQLLVPGVIPFEQLAMHRGILGKVIQYPGLKEEAYVYDFTPDRSVLDEVGGRDGTRLFTIRPPAGWAHYSHKHSEELFAALLDRLALEKDGKVLILARTNDQAEEIQKTYKLDTKIFEVRTKALDALSLMAFSEAIFSGGGTMVREAALLGWNVYSFFGGRLGAADRYLISTGRLKHLCTIEEVMQLQFPLRVEVKSIGSPARAPVADFLAAAIVRFAHDFVCR